MQNLPGASRVASMKSAKVHAEFCKQGLDTKQLWQSCVRSQALQQKDTKTGLFGRFPGIGLFPRMPNLVADLSAPLGPVEIEQLAAAYLRSVEEEDGGERIQPAESSEAVDPKPAPRSPLAAALNWADEMDLEDAERTSEEKHQKDIAAACTDVCAIAGVVSIAAAGVRIANETAAVDPAPAVARPNGRAARMALQKSGDPYASQNPFDVLVGKKVAKIEKQRAAASSITTPPTQVASVNHTVKQERAGRKATKEARTPDPATAAAPVSVSNVAEPASRPAQVTAKAEPSAMKPKPSGKIANMALQPSQSKYETYAAAALRNVARNCPEVTKVQATAAAVAAPAPEAAQVPAAVSSNEAPVEGLNPFAPLWTPSCQGEPMGYYYHDPYGALDAPAMPLEQEHLCLQDVYYSTAYCTHCPHCNPQGYPAYGEYEWQ